MKNPDLSQVSGERPVILLEGATDRIFVDTLINQNAIHEHDYVQMEGVDNLEYTLNLLVKTSLFATIPALKIIIDSDQLATRWASVCALLHLPETHNQGALSDVERQRFREKVPGSLKVGGLLWGGENSGDLEGLITSSVQDDSLVHNSALIQQIPEDKRSKRLRLAEGI